jgi:ribose transport system permease protein
MKNKNLHKILADIFPFVILASLVLLFSILTQGKLLAGRNIKSIFNEIIPLTIGGLGMIFVIAQGSTDISMGSVLAFAGTIAALTSDFLPIYLLFPVAMILGALIGSLNGLLVSYFKMPSIMVTLAVGIGLRGFVSYVTSKDSPLASRELLKLDQFGNKLIIFIVVVLVMGYLFEYTKAGHFSKAIGENEVAGRYTGIPVKKMKVLAFVLSGMVAGLLGLMTIARVGGVTNKIGNMFELQVMLAVFVGGVPVAGGMASKAYKVLLGSATIAVLNSGLALLRVSSDYSKGLQGIILIFVVFLTMYLKKSYERSSDRKIKEV